MTHKVIGMWPTTELYFKEKLFTKGFRNEKKQIKKLWKASNDGDSSTR
jgi:hypothetical protein